jgi:bifunctional non-homologous end joining protein LigD
VHGPNPRRPRSGAGAPLSAFETLEVDGRRVRVTNPEKIFFPELGVTKLDLVDYYLEVAEGVLTGCRDRPTLLKRYPNGVDGEFFYQKRVPSERPDWIQTVTVRFPSGRSAEFLTIVDAAHLAWAINLGCIDLNPWPVRRSDVDHPDELRIDIDPTPAAAWSDVRQVTLLVGETLKEHALVGFPKTSGSRGMHVYARIEPRWEFTEVRRAALALARATETKAPDLITTAWWKEQRHGVFIDYNQNARDRTLASAYSVRAVPNARVSCPLLWSEVPDVEQEDLRIDTVPKRFAEQGDPGADIDLRAGRLDSLLELAEHQEKEGLKDEAWPPHFPKQEGEPLRVAPSRAKKRVAPSQAKKRVAPSQAKKRVAPSRAKKRPAS